mmetsp:Transcript_86628/g.250183  ORF Transcript_86628/g.250183 Transcript_86628/m.250183 type:complete len:234 (+) Transcript_86628:133-834(+)|eukprot:CAMPEP_0176062262 /NCGR_PEP_ID=MMETSP0120_2-20121206/31047_1 /TAXON_ID=160619 /ORGANISM="Kryptoperidinium foliaceum, Strain CCMP 1326" /LENGTH=233 /DNA_ID=CAMNT_0017395827 /DNA_START=118 /DNA_END=819 /DNA_ORIENTATION=+
MKFTYLLPLALAVNEASAFVPQQRAFVRPAVDLYMSDEVDAPPAPVSAPAPAPAKKEAALVPIKEETVEFTAGILGGAAGLIIGGPVIAAIAAAAANYASKGESEASNIVGAVSKSAIEVYNYLAGLDNKYELLSKAQASLEKSLNKLKSQDSVDPEAVKKVEDALAATKSKISEINDEYDLVGSSVTALGVIGDLVEKTVKKVGELNAEYKLTDKAKEALNSAVAKAKEASN